LVTELGQPLACPHKEFDRPVIKFKVLVLEEEESLCESLKWPFSLIFERPLLINFCSDCQTYCQFYGESVEDLKTGIGISKTSNPDFDANLSYWFIPVNSYQFLWHSQLDANLWRT
jgi:hypothetical protein